MEVDPENDKNLIFTFRHAHIAQKVQIVLLTAASVACMQHDSEHHNSCKKHIFIGLSGPLAWSRWLYTPSSLPSSSPTLQVAKKSSTFNGKPLIMKWYTPKPPPPAQAPVSAATPQPASPVAPPPHHSAPSTLPPPSVDTCTKPTVNISSEQVGRRDESGHTRVETTCTECTYTCVYICIETLLTLSK